MKTPTNQRPNNQIKEFSLKSSSSYENKTFAGDQLSVIPKISEAEFSECVFKNCKFFEASFFDCTFENCKFENCDLASITIKYTSFQDVIFIDSKLTGIQWSDASIPLDVNFRRCLLNYSGFIGVDLRNSEILDCQLKEVDFTEANLTKANCSYSDFSGARFINTNLTHTDFTEATNYAIHPDGNKLHKTKFSLPEVISLLDVYDIIIK